MATVAFTGSTSAVARIRYLEAVSVAENAGSPAAARVLLRDTDTSGEIKADIRVTASDSKHLTFDPPLHFAGGLYVQVSAGTVRGSVAGH